MNISVFERATDGVVEVIPVICILKEYYNMQYYIIFEKSTALNFHQIHIIWAEITILLMYSDFNQ